MRFYELFTHYNTLFDPSDTVIKYFSRCTYINIAISVITRTGYNEQIRLYLGARYIRFRQWKKNENSIKKNIFLGSEMILLNPKDMSLSEQQHKNISIFLLFSWPLRSFYPGF